MDIRTVKFFLKVANQEMSIESLGKVMESEYGAVSNQNDLNSMEYGVHQEITKAINNGVVIGTLKSYEGLILRWEKREDGPVKILLESDVLELLKLKNKNP